MTNEQILFDIINKEKVIQSTSHELRDLYIERKGVRGVSMSTVMREIREGLSNLYIRGLVERERFGRQWVYMTVTYYDWARSKF